MILTFFSEMLFYSPPTDQTDFTALVLTTLSYGFATYAALLVAAWAGVRDWSGLFLAGCIFGWLIEGVIVDTVYSVLPYTLVFTGMSRHALVSVMVGFVLTRQSIRWPWRRQIGLFFVMGLGFGLWAQFWPLERVAMPTAKNTFLYLLGLGLMVPITNHLLDALPTRFEFSRKEALSIWGLAELLWASKLAISGNPAMLLLPLAIAATL